MNDADEEDTKHCVVSPSIFISTLSFRYGSGVMWRTGLFSIAFVWLFSSIVYSYAYTCVPLDRRRERRERTYVTTCTQHREWKWLATLLCELFLRLFVTLLLIPRAP
jgi:hypothetical protein